MPSTGFIRLAIKDDHGNVKDLSIEQIKHTLNHGLKNRLIGIKIQNATNIKIYESKIYNLNGLNGLDGVDDVSTATAGNCSKGIDLNDCINVTILSNSISDISGGSLRPCRRQAPCKAD